MVEMTTYIKKNSKYAEIFRTDDQLTVYQQLTATLIAKKINNCNYIKSIKRENLYNGYQKITVLETDDVKKEFIVKD